MTNPTLSKMETVDVEKERERFEARPEIKGLSKRKTIYNGVLYYVDDEVEAPWQAWIDAKRQAMEEIEVVGYQERIMDRILGGPICDWYLISKELFEDPYVQPELGRTRREIRPLYAKKGE